MSPQSDEVTLTLAHPLDAHDAVTLGLESRDYQVGSEVTLRRPYARSVINSGYAAGVEPGNREQVAKALSLAPDPAAPAATEAPKVAARAT